MIKTGKNSFRDGQYTIFFIFDTRFEFSSINSLIKLDQISFLERRLGKLLFKTLTKCLAFFLDPESKNQIQFYNKRNLFTSPRNLDCSIYTNRTPPNLRSLRLQFFFLPNAHHVRYFRLIIDHATGNGKNKNCHESRLELRAENV